MKITWDNFQKLFQDYFHKFYNTAYKKELLAFIKKLLNFVLPIAIETSYVSLYISVYHDNCLYYKLKIRCLSEEK
jgi:hypothetical protein